MPEEQIIDINDPRLLAQEPIEANPHADFFELPPPPPDSWQGKPIDYQVKILLGPNGAKVKQQSRKGDADGAPSGPFYLAFDLEVRIQDPGQPWHNMPSKYYADSLIWDSKETSKLHTVLRALGQPALGRMLLPDLQRHAIGVLAGEPVCFGNGRWEARVKDPTGEYRTVKKGMKNFPLLDPAQPDLGYSPWAEDEVHMAIDPQTKQRVQVGTGEMVRAYFNFTNFFSGQR